MYAFAGDGALIFVCLLVYLLFLFETSPLDPAKADNR